MDSYTQLRELARMRRDAAMQRIRSDYERAISHIDYLERTVGDGRDVPPPTENTRHKSRRVQGLMEEVLPRDREFTQADVLALMQAAQPDRHFPLPTLRTALGRMASKGEIELVRRGRKGATIWRVCDSPPTGGVPFAALMMNEAAEIVLRENGPMRDMEIVLAIQARGNQADQDSRDVVRSLRASMHALKRQFVRGADGRWGLRDPRV